MGMTTQQAVLNNLLSCVLAFIRAPCTTSQSGCWQLQQVTLTGTYTSRVLWRRRIVVLYIMPGIFLYVALVDMLPELTSAHSHPSSVDEKQDKKVEA